MELHRGICVLCSESTKVLKSSDANEFTKMLPDILYANSVSQTEFQKVIALIKMCGSCCYKIQLAAEIKKQLLTGKKKIKGKNCQFCNSTTTLLEVRSHWNSFSDKIGSYSNNVDYPVHICTRCMFYFDLIFSIRKKLLYKFPKLGVGTKKSNDTSQRPSETPKRKSLSISPPSSKKRKIFDNCFTYLQPLCSSDYCVADEVKKDKRLYKKIAYVNLENSKNFDVKETPKMRPVIKIKLKSKLKKGKENNTFVKTCKSEELASKKEDKKEARRHSFIVRDKTEEDIEETPKCASSANLAPKRRVSQYMENGESEDQTESNEEKAESDSAQSTEEAEKLKDLNLVETKNGDITESKSTDETETTKSTNENEIKDSDEVETESSGAINEPRESNTNEATEDLDTSEKPIDLDDSESSESAKKSDVIDLAEDTDATEEINESMKEVKFPVEKNGSDGDEETVIINDVDDDVELISTEENLINGDKPETKKDEHTEQQMLLNSSLKTPVKEVIDSDDKTNSDSEVLNGSERKKKKVTFSDDILE